jgi:hypothetical protein
VDALTTYIDVTIVCLPFGENNTKRMTVREFYKTYGKVEGKEILAGYLPHITATRVTVGHDDSKKKE